MNVIEYDKLNEGERKLVDWRIGISGDFFKTLFELIAMADSINRGILASAFPGEYKAFYQYHNEVGWWQDIERRLEL